MDDAQAGPQNLEGQQIRADVHTRRAAQVGDRIYVRCGMGSRLDELLAELGGHRDDQLGVRWLGTLHRADVLQLLDGAREWGERAGQLAAQGLWVRIPRAASDVRQMAKVTLGGVHSHKGWWAMPDEQALRLVEDAVRDWRLRQKAKKAAADSDEAVVQALQFVLVGVMRRHQAEAVMPQPGTIVRNPAGQHVQIIAAQAEFEPHEGSYDPANPDLSTGWRVYCLAVPLDVN